MGKMPVSQTPSKSIQDQLSEALAQAKLAYADAADATKAIHSATEHRATALLPDLPPEDSSDEDDGEEEDDEGLPPLPEDEEDEDLPDLPPVSFPCLLSC